MIRSHHFAAILPAAADVFVWSEQDFLRTLKHSVTQAGLHPVGELSCCYQPQGISAILLLEESHVALHFWPEVGQVTIDLHICDYQQDNYSKAETLVQLLNTTLCAAEQSSKWHYHCLTSDKKPGIATG